MIKKGFKSFQNKSLFFCSNIQLFFLNQYKWFKIGKKVEGQYKKPFEFIENSSKQAGAEQCQAHKLSGN